MGNVIQYKDEKTIKESEHLATSLSEIIKKWDKILGHDEFMEIFGPVYDYITNRKNVNRFTSDQEMCKLIDAELSNIHSIRVKIDSGESLE